MIVALLTGWRRSLTVFVLYKKLELISYVKSSLLIRGTKRQGVIFTERSLGCCLTQDKPVTSYCQDATGHDTTRKGEAVTEAGENRDPAQVPPIIV